MPTPGNEETHRLALALEGLRGTVETGFATLRGDINLLARGENHNTRRIDDLEEDVDKLKERRMPLQVIGGLCVASSVVLSVLSLIKG